VKTSSGWTLTRHVCGCVLTFKSSGLLTRQTDRNGNPTTFSYNSAGQMTGITADWGSSTIRTAHVAYGSNGFISSITQDGTDGTSHTISYGYDSSGNLTSIEDPDAGHTYAYGYDSDGNRTSVRQDGTTIQALSYTSANQISSSGYSYDGADNLITAPGMAFTYDAAEQMTQATVNGTMSSYVYPGADERELTSAGTNGLVWGPTDQYGQAWLESFNTGGTSKVYV
jgi:YD repeat-containing protein